MYMKNVNYLSTELFTIICPRQKSVYNMILTILHAYHILLHISKCVYMCVFSIGKYGRHLHVWDWKERKVIQDIDLGEEGLIPLELRFLHDPNATEGYVGIALSSNVFRFYKNDVRERTDNNFSCVQ